MTSPQAPFFAARCAPCLGTGRHNPETPCKTCEGEGLILLRGTIDQYGDCNGCVGSGFMGSNPEMTCGRCEGTGAMRVKSY